MQAECGPTAPQPRQTQPRLLIHHQPWCLSGLERHHRSSFRTFQCECGDFVALPFQDFYL